MRGAVNVSHLSADDWSTGLISGNGRQGAVVHGDPTALRVTLSHERLFLPVHEPLPAPGTARILPRLRELCLARNFQAAADAVVALAVDEDPRYGVLREADPFIGAAVLVFASSGPRGRVEGWRRSVDHATAVVTHEWHDADGEHRHELFVSRADDVVVARWSEPAVRRMRLPWLEAIPGEPPVPVVPTWLGPLQLRVAFPTAWPGAVTGYAVTTRSRVENGRLTLVARTVVEPDVDAELPEPSYEELLSRHVPRHAALFDRCRLRLSQRSTATTEALLAEAVVAPELVERLFDAGRYAIICASGTLPPNLQGVWSGTYRPAWRAAYTMDGNLAAAVSGLCATGTPELLLPLFDLFERFRSDMRDNARRLYGLPGLLVPPHLSTHGRHNHFTARWCLTFWTAGAAWIARLYHEYWRYTGDEAFYRDRALPFMREAAAFYEAFITASGFVPSYSPENSPQGADGPQATVNATMDIAAVSGLMRDLGRPMDGLPAYRVDPDGALAEWCWDGLTGHHAHRHASHLYGLWYEPDPDLVDDPDLAAAAATSIRRRLDWWRSDQSGEMAYGLAQLGLAAAALGLAPEAYECLCLMASRYWRPNLVSTHNRGELFNVDICGAFPAMVVAMLIQQRGRRISLLPARPTEWPTGRIAGVWLRDGIRVEALEWSPGRVAVELCGPRTDVTLLGPRGDAVTVCLGTGPARRVEMEA